MLTSGTKIEKIITVHPIIEPVSAYLLYVAYDGWIFSGRHVWRVDKISLREGKTGDYLSHCKSSEAETVLRSGMMFFKGVQVFCPVHPAFAEMKKS